ncbi:MAG TPA: molybdenum cofactor guanylyltransferase [Candidatus Eremiobacteraceae bacterium]|jgi:molybdopterin-guanine dinucleotide biosynthesis protein A
MPLDATGADARFTIVVLAGGNATRLPGKLALPIDGEPMLARVLHALSATGAPCLVAAGTRIPDAIAADDAVRVVYDEYPGEGPLAALVSAAAAVRTPYFFAVAGDMPGIDAAFIGRVVAAAEAAHWPDAIVPLHPEGTLEPLAALYKREPWVMSARAALAKNRRNVSAALDGLRVAYYQIVPEDEPALANVNTPSDYKRLGSASRARDWRP